MTINTGSDDFTSLLLLQNSSMRLEELGNTNKYNFEGSQNTPLSLRGHVVSQANKKLCFCMASLTQTRIQCEASRAKTKLFILLRLNMATE